MIKFIQFLFLSQRKIITQQKFINEARLSSLQLPNLVTQKSSSSQTLTNMKSSERLTTKQSLLQKDSTNQQSEIQEDKNEENIDNHVNPENQIAKRKSSQFYVQQKKKMSGLLPNSQGAQSYTDLGNLGTAIENQLSIDFQKSSIQFETPRAQLGMNIKYGKNIAQQLITPLKMLTPNRYTNSMSQKMDQSLSEFLDFNNALIFHHKEKKKGIVSKIGIEQVDFQKSDIINFDISKIVLHDFIVMGKDLFAAGTNNGQVQIWKYKDFKFICTFQTQAHFSPVNVSATNVSGIIFTIGINQKGQNSVKIWNNDTEASLTEIIEILELHPAKSTITHLLSLAEVFKGSSNNIIFATYGTDDINILKVWDFSFDNKNFQSQSKNQIKQKMIINTDNTELSIIKQDFEKNIFIGCSKNCVIFWKYQYNKESQKLEVQKLHNYTFKINLEENRIIDVEMGLNNVYVSTKNGEIVLLELNGVFIKSIQFFAKYLKQTHKEDVSDLSLRKVLYFTTPEKIIILCQKNENENIIPYLFDKVEAQHEIMSTIKIQQPLKLVINMSETQFVTLEKSNILKYNYL